MENAVTPTSSLNSRRIGLRHRMRPHGSLPVLASLAPLTRNPREVVSTKKADQLCRLGL